MFSFAGSGNIAFARNTAFITTPGRDYGQGGVFGRKLNNRSLGFATKNFENPAYHRKLKNNKAYTKGSDKVFFRNRISGDQIGFLIMYQTNLL